MLCVYFTYVTHILRELFAYIKPYVYHNEWYGSILWQWVVAPSHRFFDKIFLRCTFEMLIRILCIEGNTLLVTTWAGMCSQGTSSSEYCIQYTWTNIDKQTWILMFNWFPLLITYIILMWMAGGLAPSFSLLYFTGNVEITWLLFIFCRPYSSLSDRLQRKEKVDPYILIQNDLKDVNDAIMKV